MAKKNLTFDVVASYQPKDDTIHLTTKNKDSRKSWHLTLNRRTETEEIIRQQLIEAGIIKDANMGIPEIAAYPAFDTLPWDEFPLGVTRGGKQVVWHTRAEPHLLLGGPTGSGKSVVQRALIAHAIQHPEWQIIGIDLKRVELAMYKQFSDTVKSVAVDLETSVEALRQVHEVMMERYGIMEEAEVTHFTKLQDDRGIHPKAIMVLVDEAWVLLSPEALRTTEGKQRDMWHAEAAHLLLEIARLGRAAGVHLVLGTQRVDAAVIPGALRAQFGIRVSAGRLTPLQSAMLLDSDEGVDLPRIKGRGMVVTGAESQQTQFYWTSPAQLHEQARRYF